MRTSERMRRAARDWKYDLCEHDAELLEFADDVERLEKPVVGDGEWLREMASRTEDAWRGNDPTPWDLSYEGAERAFDWILAEMLDEGIEATIRRMWLNLYGEEISQEELRRQMSH